MLEPLHDVVCTGAAAGLPNAYNPQDYANLDVTPDVQVGGGCAAGCCSVLVGPDSRSGCVMHIPQQQQCATPTGILMHAPQLPAHHLCHCTQDLFKYIGRYRPASIELETRLKPFIPDFIPALGSIDEFIKVPRPDGRPDWLGLKVRKRKDLAGTLDPRPHLKLQLLQQRIFCCSSVTVVTAAPR